MLTMQDIRKRVCELLEHGGHVEGTEAAEELEDVMAAYRDVRFCVNSRLNSRS